MPPQDPPILIPPPGALESVKRILDDLATFLWNTNASQPHVAAPIINPHAASILRYENERLKQFLTYIRNNTNYEGNPSIFRTFLSSFNFSHWIWPKVFKCIDIILNSLDSVPGVGFVRELKEQLENALLS